MQRNGRVAAAATATRAISARPAAFAAENAVIGNLIVTDPNPEALSESLESASKSPFRRPSSTIQMADHW
jgi:hypothetical protein